MGIGLGNTLAGDFRNDVFGTSDQADAAQNAADQQRRMAYGQQEAALTYATNYGKDLSSIAQANPQEMLAYGNSLSAASKQLDQQQRLIDSIDPALMEASKQVLGILRGDQTGVGNAIGRDRMAQRQELVNSLRSQYGPGAESSSIGSRTLANFDRETSALGAQSQNQSLGALSAFMAGAPTANSGIQAVGQASQLFGANRQQQMAAKEAGGGAYMNALFGTNQAVLNTAGSDQTRRMITSGAQRQFWDNWSDSSMRFGESFGGMGMSKAMGGGGGGGGGVQTNSFAGVPQAGQSYRNTGNVA